MAGVIGALRLIFSEKSNICSGICKSAVGLMFIYTIATCFYIDFDPSTTNVNCGTIKVN